MNEPYRPGEGWLGELSKQAVFGCPVDHVEVAIVPACRSGNVVFFDRHGASSEPATKELWIYDFRTNQHFTLKTKTLKRSDLDDFVAAYKSGGEPHGEPERYVTAARAGARY